MAASNKPTAVHYSLIFFVMLSIILGVTTYMYVREYSDSFKKEVVAKSDLAKANTNWKNAIADVDALKALIGKGNLDKVVDLTNANDPTTVVGSANDEMQKLGGPLRESTLLATLAKFRQALDTAVGERDSKTDLAASTDTDLRAVLSRQQANADQFKRKWEAAEADKDKVINDRNEQIAAKDAAISKLETDKRQAELELREEKQARTDENKKKQDEINKLVAINEKIYQELQDIKKETFDRADGYVRRVDNVSRIVWLNIGDADFLKPRMTFSVYGKETPGVGRTPADIKGKVEVTRVIDAHLSEAKILDEDQFRPMAPGDAVYTPLWSPGRTEKFAVVGGIDMDGDKKYDPEDRKLFEAELKLRSSVLGSQVNDKGDRLDEYGQPQSAEAHIDETYKFLIIGHIPDKNDAITDEDKRSFQAIYDHHKAMTSEARLHGVRVMNLSEFLDYIGYKPKQRLFRPGENSPYKIKSGVPTPSVNPPMGERSSSSGSSYGRGKAQAPSPSGQAVKSFGRSN